MARHSQRDGNERGADRRIDACLRLPRMAVLHPRAGRSRIKSESDFARVYAAGIGIWLSLVGRPQSPHRVGHTIGRGRRRCGSRVLGMGEAAPSFPESCRSLRRGADGNAVRAWARSMRPRDRRRLLGQGRPCARISAWRPLDRAVLLDRDLLGLSRFLERMDPMPGSSCSCCSTYAGSPRIEFPRSCRISSLLPTRPDR